MRSLLSVAIVAVLFGCSKEYSVMEELSVNEVRRLIEQDSLYEQIISEVDMTRRLVKENIVLTSKFLDLSYNSYLNYKRSLTDTVFLAPIERMAQREYQERASALVVSYQTRIDSFMQVYRSRIALSNPERFFSIEFDGIDREYHSLGRYVKSVNIKFRIKPLRGTIEGGSFEYNVIPKSTGRSAASGRCRFSSTTSEPATYIWEAPYDVKKAFESLTPLKIVERYTFEFSVLSARVNDTIFDVTNASNIPASFQPYLEHDSLSTDAYLEILRDFFRVEPDSEEEIFEEYLDSGKKELNLLAWEFEQLSVLSTLQQAIKLFGGSN